MKLFKSKAEKEQERKMLVKRSMRELEKRIRKLEEQEAKYVQLAKQGMDVGLPEQVKLAKEALRMTISERKRTYKMYLNAQIISQMKDMTAMTNEFLNAIHVISKDISGSATADMSKLSNELRMAMERVSEQTENLGEMLEDSQDDVMDFSVGNSLVSDDELDSMIYGTASATTSTSNMSIDAELEALKQQLNK
jgi:hypothetical protein